MLSALKKSAPFEYIAKFDASDIRLRAPMAIAILSVLLQEYPIWIRRGFLGWFSTLTDGTILSSLTVHLFALVLAVASALAVSKRTHKIALSLFVFVVVFAILPDWTALANHTYLAIWTLSVAIIFSEWWESRDYQTYLRATLAIAMIAAFSQKILAGTYIDGSFLTYLGKSGSTTEGMFTFLCEPNSNLPCEAIRYLSIFILVWQLGVGILLLTGLNSTLFLIVEIGFLLGAGVYADEMNFQVLNIALLSIAFRYGMPIWLLSTCLFFLFIDLFTISKIIDAVM